MSNTNKKAELYAKCRKILGSLTPLKADCGVLCGKACCKGDERTGMLLFPDEQTKLSVTECEAGRLAVCDGTCDRETRPLACMIFPFFPTVADNGEIFAEIDSRAYSVCPIAANCDDVLFDEQFIRAVKKCGEILSQDEECLEFMVEVTEDIDLYESLYGEEYDDYE